jgi:hypothetical protein
MINKIIKVILISILIFSCNLYDKNQTTIEQSVEIIPEPVNEPVKEITLEEKLSNAISLTDALELVTPLFKDTKNDPIAKKDFAAFEFSKWADKNNDKFTYKDINA